MSIATRINSMENNIRNAYHGLDSIGIDTTNTNKNIENISALLDDFYDSLPKVSGTGTNISLSPTRKGRITSQINGDTFQQTYTGKNLLEDTMITTATEKNGITATPVYENGLLQYINFNGTATKNTYFNISRQNFGETSFNSDTGGSTEYIATSDNEILRLTYDASNNYSYFYVANGRSVSNEKAYPMIRLASVSDSNYEPYVGGTASPNPEFPQEIQSVTGLQKISVKGSNIFDNSVGGTSGQYLNDSGNVSTGYVTLNYSDYIVIPENETKLYVSGMETDLMNAPAICFYDSNKIFISGERYNSRATATINIPTNAKYFRTSYRTNYTNFMIQTLDMYDINLGDIHLYENDQIIGTPNNWSIKHIMGEVVFDGSETAWEYISVAQGSLFRNKSIINTSKNDSDLVPYCNYYKGISYNDSSSRTNNDIYIRPTVTPNWLDIIDNRFTNLNDFKNSLSINKPKLVYELATPTTEPITNTELISQLNAFYYAMSKNGETNISVDGNLPIILDVSALKGEE